MCFSAQASFVAASVLSVAALYSIKESYQSKRLWMFGMVPLFFAAQQAVEGMIWLVFTHQIAASHLELLTYLYLFFALIVWPAWIPVTVYQHEMPGLRKMLIGVTVLIGWLTAAYLAYTMYLHGVQAEPIGHHIVYHHAAMYTTAVSLMYLVATVLPFFISANMLFNLFGILLALSCLVAYVVWQVAFASLWCFSAAILSLAIVAIIKKELA